MKVAIIGANGQLGAELCLSFAGAGHTVCPLTHQQLEIADAAAVPTVLTALKPDCVINTAALHNVEQCEKQPEQSYAVNALGSRNLAIACHSLDSYLVHVSTDYVFDGAKTAPYLETDAPLPLNVYGNTKLAGEYFVRAEAARAAVVRVSGVYGRHPCRAKGGMNFVRLMLKLGAERDEVRVVDDEVLTPTCAEDIARQLVRLAEQQPAGLFHATAQGACSWYQFAAHIFERVPLKARLEKARPGEFPAKVRRPNYSVLDNQALRQQGLDLLPDWRDGLDRYLATIT